MYYRSVHAYSPNHPHCNLLWPHKFNESFKTHSLFLVRGHLHLAPALGGGGYGDSPRAHALTRVAHHPPLYSAAEKFAIEALLRSVQVLRSLKVAH